jgi:putative acetyltransferase
MESDGHGRMYAVAVRAPASCRGFSFCREAASPVGLPDAQFVVQSAAVLRQYDSGQMTMGAVYRVALRKDASRLCDIRRRAILELAPPTMSVAEAQAWAVKLTPSGMEQKLRELEVWVAELDGRLAGWGAIRGGTLEGLYVAPEFAGQGVGAGLLDTLEGLMRDRAFPRVRAEASSNARGFYLRRGYVATGPQTPDGAWPIGKELPT